MSDTFTMKSWTEKIVTGPEDGPRVACAHAVMTYTGAIEGESVLDLLLYSAGEGYDGEGTAAPGFERFEGTVDGRKGTFVIKHETGFDTKGIHSVFTIVPGSGTGELAGLTGSGTTSGSMGE